MTRPCFWVVPRVVRALSLCIPSCDVNRVVLRRGQGRQGPRRQEPRYDPRPPPRGAARDAMPYRVGESAAGYMVIHAIGRGAFGEVFKAAVALVAARAGARAHASIRGCACECLVVRARGRRLWCASEGPGFGAQNLCMAGAAMRPPP